ncbi:multidrug efflux SMR transporter [Actinosynnema pretiosum subsp. pretiosum]|uniref:Small multidrug resistance protein n=2 Tax=Actinosynnema TaxID=40566 RepID=C6WR54_ACTMD|nr:multidrug efflux SMR transporter [Actinosynnema mirum]ACU40747.1 small multidrug resistance protein [Actinosynnema mirum DSM 43827]AXX34253.1 Ethidium bromide-methyl viologen resistance protein EmrE [Actinosynnema pretiosum subsp. pretiosum]QUF02032.1 multidrug efflux SMR transporter [Actinosynnema pretiosum subsp. pretiosum]
MVYLLLALAIVAEVTATVSLKLSAGFTKLAPSVVVVIAYALAFGALSQVLKLGMPLGVAYAIWCAFGIAAVAAVGVVLFGERVNATMVVGLLLVIAGVVAIELGSSSGS